MHQTSHAKNLSNISGENRNQMKLIRTLSRNAETTFKLPQYKQGDTMK